MACTSDRLTSPSDPSASDAASPATTTGAERRPQSTASEAAPDEASAGVAFDGDLRTRLEANLARLERVSYPLEGRRHAAVSVVIVGSDPDALDADRPGAPGARLPVPAQSRRAGAGMARGAAVLLTRRAARLPSHAGQWALPGGRLDPGESALDAARRELREELGLDLDAGAVIGVLDDYPTRSGYVITPFVLWGGPDPHLHPDPGEVGSVHQVSFRELCRPDSPRFITIPESDRPVVQILVGDGFIHAPTGAVLLQFRRVGIEGIPERVAEYEQPVFAWR